MAYVDHLKEKALQEYYVELELYAQGLTKKPPKPPEILNGRRAG